MEKTSGTLPWAGICYGVDLQEAPALSGGAPDDARAGQSRMIVVRAERTRGDVKYAAVAPDDPSFRNDIEAGQPAAGCLSVRESFTRWLTTPLASLSKARRVLPTLLDIQLPFALEDCVCDFLCFGRESGVTRALAVAARQSEIRKKLESFARAGLDPFVLDQEGLALWTQSLREWPAPPEQADVHRVIVSLGQDRSTVVIGRGERFQSAHGIPSADPGAIGRLLRTEIGVGDGGGGPGVLWLWTGVGAGNSGLVSNLHERLSATWPGRMFVHHEPDTFLARALATRALTAGSLRCNLRAGSLVHPTVAHTFQRQALRAMAASLLAGIFLCAANFVVQNLIDRREAEMDRAFSSLRNGLMGHAKLQAKGQRALDAVRTKLEKEKEDLKPFVHALEPSLMNRMASMAEIGTKDRLTYDTLSLSRANATVSGTAGKWDGCERLMSFLRASGYSGKVERKDALPDGKIPFSIKSGGNDG